MGEKERVRRMRIQKRMDEEEREVNWVRVVYIIIFLLAAALLYLIYSATEVQASTSWSTRYQSEYKTDYYLHYVEGAAIGTITWFCIPDKWELNYFQKWLVAVGTATLYKTVYEVFDTGGDYRDVVEVATGAMIVVPIFMIRW